MLVVDAKGMHRHRVERRDAGGLFGCVGEMPM